MAATVSCHLEPVSELSLHGASNTPRHSPDESSRPHSRQFLVDVDHTLESLQEQEDTDKNMQITIEDAGPKVCC